jgi:hypothetical protein
VILAEKDPRAPQIEKDLLERKALLNALVEPQLDTVLTQAAVARAEERQKLRAEATSLVDGLLKKLEKARPLAELEANPWMPVALHSRLVGPLDALAHQLGS